MTKRAAKQPAAPDTLRIVDLYDNSQIEEYCKCERRYYFRYVRHWVSTKPNENLAFGSAWHKGMDAVWAAICWEGTKDIDATALGIEAFMQEWTGLGFPDADDWASMSKEEQDDLLPQSPMTAMEMMYEYVKVRGAWLRGIELLEVEKPFIVPISTTDPTTMYTGKIDKVFRRDSRIYAIDHKTTSMYSKEGYFRSMWLEGFNPNRQLDGYLHQLRMVYGREVKAVWADCALVHKSVHDGFRFLPIEHKDDAMMSAWLWETWQRIGGIQGNKAALAALTPDSRYLAAFPRKTEACTLYNTACPYLDMCKMVANPESLEEAPPGFKEEAWSPLSDEQLIALGLQAKVR